MTKHDESIGNAKWKPFYLVIDRSNGVATRKHNIHALDELE